MYETHAFDVRSGVFGQAVNYGPKITGDWNVDIADGVQPFYTHVFRAAYRYHHKDIGRLSRLYLSGFSLKYAARDCRGKNGIGLFKGNITFGTVSNITINRYNHDGREYNSDAIFSATCHEAAHSAHWSTMNAGGIQFLQVDRFIRESWAVACGWFLTRKEYKERGISNYGDPDYNGASFYLALYGYQYWNKTVFPSTHTYTSVFINLVDDFNEPGVIFPGRHDPRHVDDRVTGCTLYAIQSTFLKYVYGLTSLQEQLKENKPAGVTNEQIERLL